MIRARALLVGEGRPLDGDADDRRPAARSRHQPEGLAELDDADAPGGNDDGAGPLGGPHDLAVAEVVVGGAHVRLRDRDDLDREVLSAGGASAAGAGAASATTVPAGGLGVVGLDEAFRLMPGNGGQAAIIRVTVEGASFPNK